MLVRVVIIDVLLSVLLFFVLLSQRVCNRFARRGGHPPSNTCRREFTSAPFPFQTPPAPPLLHISHFSSFSFLTLPLLCRSYQTTRQVLQQLRVLLVFLATFCPTLPVRIFFSVCVLLSLRFQPTSQLSPPSTIFLLPSTSPPPFFPGISSLS